MRASFYKPHTKEVLREDFTIFPNHICIGDRLTCGRVVEVTPLMLTSQHNYEAAWDYEFLKLKVKQPVFANNRVYIKDAIVYAAVKIDPVEMFNGWWPRGYSAMKTK